MDLHHYDRETGEYTGSSAAQLDVRETRAAGHPVYLSIPHATTIAPPEAVDGMARIFDGERWGLVDDHRGVPMYSKVDGHSNSMVALGPIPEDYTSEAPPAGMIRPMYEGGTWIEQAIVFQGREVASKADVDAITRLRIIDLGEEKAKTEKLLAGSDPCPLWDAFIAQRAILLQEGDAFVAANDLT